MKSSLIGLSLLVCGISQAQVLPGIYLVESGNDRIMRFDTAGNYIEDVATGLGTTTPLHASTTADGANFLLTDQVLDKVLTVTPTGTILADFYTPLDNIRGIDKDSSGNYYLGAGGTTPGVAKLDSSGAFVSQFNTVTGAWHCFPRSNGEFLVSSSSSGASLGVGRYDASGTYLGDFVIGYGFTEQIAEAQNGNILIASFTTVGANASGLWEFDSSGLPLLRYNISGARGVVELSNGDLLATAGSTVVYFQRGNPAGTTLTGLGGTATNSYRMFYKHQSGSSERRISGTITLQDLIPDEAGQDVTWTLLDSGNNVVDSGTTTLGAGGSYSISVIPTSGDHSLIVKGATWLGAQVSGLSLNTSVTGADFSLINGDVDGDNEVGPNDFSILSTAFGTSLGDSGYVAGADLDKEEEVGPSDFSILSNNFGQSGD